MIRSLCTTNEDPRDTYVVLTIKDVTVSGDGGSYKISFDENPSGTFHYNEDEAFDHNSENLGRVTADFICIGRYYNIMHRKFLNESSPSCLKVVRPSRVSPQIWFIF